MTYQLNQFLEEFVFQWYQNCSTSVHVLPLFDTVKLGDKERFDKEQIGIKEPFPVTNC